MLDLDRPERQRLSRRAALEFVGAAVTGGAAAAAQTPAEDLTDYLVPILRESRFPALGAAVVLGGRTAALGAVGIRKVGDSTPVTAGDRFHLGSCTKAMTATLLGKLVDDGKLAWSTTLSDLFPATEFKLDSGYRSVTVEQLLAHRAGCPASGWPPGMQISDVRALVGTPREQRRSYARRLLAKPPETPPGTRYLYSNASFALAGIIAEQVMGQAYETLMAEHLFKPLGMTGVGFGAMGTPGRVDQPWQHRLKGEQLEPIGPGPTSDNPPSIAPAGTVHCTLADWARFARLHVDGETDGGGLLSVSTCKRLHRAPAGGTYGGGWIVTDRPWAGGRALTHGGSNTQNYAILWVAPARRFAAMAVTNVGGGNRPFQVCDRVISGLVRRYLS